MNINEIDSVIHQRIFDYATTSIPAYSTDLGAAFTIVDRLHTLGLDDFNLDSDGTTWSCFISDFNMEAGGQNGQADAPTPSLAICLAALKVFDK